PRSPSSAPGGRTLRRRRSCRRRAMRPRSWRSSRRPGTCVRGFSWLPFLVGDFRGEDRGVATAHRTRPRAEQAGWPRRSGPGPQGCVIARGAHVITAAPLSLEHWARPPLFVVSEKDLFVVSEKDREKPTKCPR